MLQLNKISYNYPENVSFKGLKNISFELKDKHLLTILGKSGSGKSTLLKCIYGLTDLHSGSIFFNDEQVLGPAYNLIPGHPKMKLVSQEYYVLENNTVEENVREMLAGYTDEYKQKRIKEVLKALELTKFAAKKAKELSSGQRQRLSIARALADFPDLLLLDEPFSNLDFSKRDRLFAFIKDNLETNNSSCIFVTHHPDEALRYSDDLLIMEEGKVLAHDLPEKIYKKPASIEIARLFGKCFVLTKEDVVLSAGLKFTGGELLVRPEQLKKVGKQNKELRITAIVVNCFFVGKNYEVQVKTAKGKLLSFYSDEKIKKGEPIYLSIL